MQEFVLYLDDVFTAQNIKNKLELACMFGGDNSEFQYTRRASGYICAPLEVQLISVAPGDLTVCDRTIDIEISVSWRDGSGAYDVGSGTYEVPPEAVPGNDLHP